MPQQPRHMWTRRVDDEEVLRGWEIEHYRTLQKQGKVQRTLSLLANRLNIRPRCWLNSNAYTKHTRYALQATPTLLRQAVTLILVIE